MFSAMCRKVAGRLNTTEFAGSGLYRKRAPPELGDRQTILYLPITYFLYSLRKRKNNKYILPPPLPFSSRRNAHPGPVYLTSGIPVHILLCKHD
jgi:hypothetical protein